MTEKPGDPSPAADEIFSEFRRRLERGEPADIEELCRQHPEHADVLMGLYSAHFVPDPEGSPPTEGPTRTDAPPGGGGGDRSPPTFRGPPPPAGPAPGSDGSIGPYRLLGLLGEGGFGFVHLAEQERPIRRKVALKILKPGMSSEEFLARFEAERQALALMDHPSVVKVLDAGTTREGQAYFVMEYVDGARLDRYLAERELDLDGRLELFVRICDAVAHAHTRAAVLHRDLKPPNIIVTDGDDGKPFPRIIDFGLVKAMKEPLTDRPLHTRTGVFMGTAEYMSVEQASGEAGEVDFRTDVYSLGVILYELVTGVLPIPSEAVWKGGITRIPGNLRDYEPVAPRSRLQVLAQESQGEKANRMRSLRRRLRPEIDWVIMMALEKDRTRRHATVADLREDVERYRRGEPVRARKPGLAYRAWRQVRRHRVASFSVAGALLLLLAYGTVDHLLTVRERANRVRENLATAKRLWSPYRSVDGGPGEQDRVIETLRAEHREQAGREPSWLPVWERAGEIRAWVAYQEALRERETAYRLATQSLREGLNIEVTARRDRAEIRSLLEEIGEARYRESIRKGGIRLSPEYFRALFLEARGGDAEREIARETVTLQSEPPGAAVHCFRYVYSPGEGRLLPLPFDPRRVRESIDEGVVGAPFLEVERRWADAVPRQNPPPFEPGDRLRSINGSEVRTLARLAASLEGVATGGKVDVVLERRGAAIRNSWVPFPADRVREVEELAAEAGSDLKKSGPWPRLLHPFLQFGFTFAGYPLETGVENLVGTTAAEPLAVTLPEGSYLLIFRRDGYEDTRLPVAVPGEPRELRVRLLGEDEIPPGCVHVPAGPVATGGDPAAFNSLEPEVRTVPGFWIGKHEVTGREWMEFVTEIRDRIDEEGTIEPRVQAVRDELHQIGDARVRVIPGEYGVSAKQGGLYWKRKGQLWVLDTDAFEREDWPVLGISHLAALEYLHWRTERAAGEGKPWRYRLPTNLEWERAARGVDRRFYPWGNYNIWSFSWSVRGNFVKLPDRVGISPADESVFGLRDLAGSVKEHIRERYPGTRNRFYRGGSWDELTELYFRVSSRSSLLPEESPWDIGLRVVVELVPTE